MMVVEQLGVIRKPITSSRKWASQFRQGIPASLQPDTGIRPLTANASALQRQRYAAAISKQARDQRIKQAEANNRLREPTTPLEIEAHKRVATYDAERKFQSDRRRFEAQLSVLPVNIKRKVRELIQRYRNYESLPGYSEFAAGRMSVKDMIPGMATIYNEFITEAFAARSAKDTARDAADAESDRLYAEQQAAKALKKVQDKERLFQMQMRAGQEAEIRRQASKSKRAVKAAEEAAKKQVAAELRRENRRAASAAAKSKLDADRLEHPFLQGSPPVSAAINQVSTQMGIEPGPMDQNTYRRLEMNVYNRARQHYGSYYYYKPGRSSKYRYSVNRAIVKRLLAQEGYTLRTAQSAVSQQSPVPAPVEAAAPKPVLTLPSRPAEPSVTTSGRDPMIQEAIRLAMQKSGIGSGQEVVDIRRFEQNVIAEVERLGPSRRKIARRVDVAAAIMARLRFVLDGIAV